MKYDLTFSLTKANSMAANPDWDVCVMLQTECVPNASPPKMCACKHDHGGVNA